MSLRRIILVFAMLAGPAYCRELVGAFAGWAAFCDEPTKCFAIAQPAERRGVPSLAVAANGRKMVVTANVGRSLRAARLRIGSASFPLAVTGERAIANDADSRRIVAALRESEYATVVALLANGGRIRHHYELAGAPSAIDAAMIASRR